MIENAKVEFVSKLIEWIESSSAFVKGQLPEYIEQLMIAKTIECWMNTFFILLALMAVLGLWIFCWKTSSTNEKFYVCPTHIALGTFMLPIALIPLSLAFVCQLQDLVYLHFAPKVFILSHLKDLIK